MHIRIYCYTCIRVCMYGLLRSYGFVRQKRTGPIELHCAEQTRDRQCLTQSESHVEAVLVQIASHAIHVALTAVRHPLLVVKCLAFHLLLGTDILWPHGAMLTFDESAHLRLRTRVCNVCREQRTDILADLPIAPLTACAASAAVIKPCTAAFIDVRVPLALRDVSTVAVEPLASLLEEKGCAVLPSVLAVTDSVFYVAVLNSSNCQDSGRRASRHNRSRRSGTQLLLRLPPSRPKLPATRSSAKC